MKSVKIGEVRYRIVCAAQGEGHGLHRYEMKDRAAAEESAARHDALPNRPEACRPWRVEAQVVSEWGDPDAAEMCLYAVGRTLEGRLL